MDWMEMSIRMVLLDAFSVSGIPGFVHSEHNVDEARRDALPQLWVRSLKGMSAT